MEENKFKVDIENFSGRRRYERFTKEPSPSVCITGRFDVTKLYKLKKKGHSFNALLLFAIQEASQKIEEFHYALKKDGLYYYKNIKTNAVIYGKDGELYFVDYKYADNFKDFEKEYHRVNDYYSNACQHFVEDTGSLLSTSAVKNFPLESVSIDVSSTFWDNFLLWGKFEKKLFRVKLNISLRFHHALMDMGQASQFFKNLQEEIDNFKI